MQSKNSYAGATIEALADGRALTVPTGKVLAHFFPNEDFYCEDLKSEYKRGHRYYVREGNVKLKTLVNYWSETKRVELEIVK